MQLDVLLLLVELEPQSKCFVLLVPRAHTSNYLTGMNLSSCFLLVL